MVGEQFVKPDSVFSKLQKVLLKCNPMFFSVVTSLPVLFTKEKCT